MDVLSTFTSTSCKSVVATASYAPQQLAENEAPLRPQHASRLAVRVYVSAERRRLHDRFRINKAPSLQRNLVNLLLVELPPLPVE